LKKRDVLRPNLAWLHHNEPGVQVAFLLQIIENAWAVWCQAERRPLYGKCARKGKCSALATLAALTVAEGHATTGRHWRARRMRPPVVGTQRSSMPTALIIGISGQDGALLADLLLRKGYTVSGTSRDVEGRAFANLEALGLAGKVQLRSMNALELSSILNVLADLMPDEIYNLGGQSSVGLSFDQPAETLSSIVIGTQNILEALRTTRSSARFYSAGSSECFGETGELPATEATPFRPISPYAVAKACAFWQVASYRDAYGIHAVTGLLFNHESRFRPPRFVTSKIIRTAKRIAAGSDEKLVLGNVDIVRDWGHAADYVDAMWRLMQTDQPRDVVIASGISISLRRFAEAAFDACGLDLGDHLRIDPTLFRPNEIRESRADPSAARKDLGWTASISGPALVQRLVDETAL
jgi:GDPmannose 4,6-dehydratase